LTPIRPLEHDDLPAVAALYADFVNWGPGKPMPGFIEFFRSTLLEHPFADPEIPSLVYDDPRDGVVGVIGSHPRPFLHRGERVRMACNGPLVVHPDYRSSGVGALLLRGHLAGAQDMTFNDRTIDQVHEIWGRLGGATQAAASIGWSRVVAPVGCAAASFTRRAFGRRPPGRALLSRIDALAGRRRLPTPTGTIEPLTPAGMLDLLPRLERDYPLRPAYDEAFLAWLFSTMEVVDSALGHLVRRLVRADDGRPAGAYVMYVSVLGRASVIQIATGSKDVGLTIDHLLRDAANEGAVEVRGRVEPGLLPKVRTRGFRFTCEDYAIVYAKDPKLVGTVLSGRALLSRLEGEWWMRPRPLTD
jgi:predicted N-acetyltransferase YhbS